MTATRKNDAILCILLALTLMLSNAMPFFVLGKMSANGGKMIVCSSSEGTKVIDKSDTQKKHCQFCYFSLSAQPKTPDVPEIAQASEGGVIAKRLFGFGGPQLQNQLYSNNHNTRAPPYFA